MEGGAGGVRGDVDLLRSEWVEVHLDAGEVGIPAGAMGEAGGVEVGAEIAVEAGEDVAVEGGGDTGGIVVGVEDGLDGLGRAGVGAGGEVGAKEQAVSGMELRAEVGQEPGGFRGREVADAGADIEGEDAGVLGADAGAGQGEGFYSVVGDLRADSDAGDVGFDVGGGFVERAPGDVDGLVEDSTLAADGCLEEDAGLGGGSCAELEQGEGVAVGGCGEDLVGVLGEDGALRAGQVVLG